MADKKDGPDRPERPPPPKPDDLGNHKVHVHAVPVEPPKESKTDQVKEEHADKIARTIKEKAKEAIEDGAGKGAKEQIQRVRRVVKEERKALDKEGKHVDIHVNIDGETEGGKSVRERITEKSEPDDKK